MLGVGIYYRHGCASGERFSARPVAPAVFTQCGVQTGLIDARRGEVWRAHEVDGDGAAGALPAALESSMRPLRLRRLGVRDQRPRHLARLAALAQRDREHRAEGAEPLRQLRLVLQRLALQPADVQRRRREPRRGIGGVAVGEGGELGVGGGALVGYGMASKRFHAPLITAQEGFSLVAKVTGPSSSTMFW